VNNIPKSDISGVVISSNAVPCHILFFENTGVRSYRFFLLQNSVHDDSTIILQIDVDIRGGVHKFSLHGTTSRVRRPMRHGRRQRKPLTTAAHPKSLMLTCACTHSHMHSHIHTYSHTQTPTRLLARTHTHTHTRIYHLHTGKFATLALSLALIKGAQLTSLP